MSDKTVSFAIPGVDEDTDTDVRVAVSADFLNPNLMYLNIDGRSVQISGADAISLAEFVLREARA